MLVRPNQEVINQYNDKSFPALTIKQFAARQLQVAEENVVDALFNALTAEKQTAANKELIEKAMNYSVNASGAIMLMVNTNHGLHLVCANSQRRKKVVASNGACEANESMAETAQREFVEESGNPAANGILSTIVNHIENCRSLEVTNKIGQTASQIANRIVDTGADKGKLYINISSIYANSESVSLNLLQSELDELNKELRVAAPFYLPAVFLLFGDKATGVKAADFSQANVRAEACRQINDFISRCQSSITANFAGIFNGRFDANTDVKAIKEALNAIVDLTENNEIGLITKAELVQMLLIDFTKKENLDAFKGEYFMPAFENILLHKGKKAAGEFLASLENVASKASKITFGMLSTAATSTDAAVADNSLHNTLTK